MNPAKVRRERLQKLTDLPNVGPATARDLRRLGIDTPARLVGRDPFEMYDTLCLLTQTRQDPCVLDVFIAVTRFMAGDEARPWWAYTAARQQAVARMQRSGIRDEFPPDNHRISA